MDPMDMSEAEFLLYRRRQWAAERYRLAGFAEYAQRVVRGAADDCTGMALATFFVS